MKKDHSIILLPNGSEKIKNKGQEHCITLKKGENIESIDRTAGQATGKTPDTPPGALEENK